MRRTAPEVGPAAQLEVVELAAARGVAVPAPRERLHHDVSGQLALQQRLRGLQAVQRDAHVHVMRRVLHDVVQHAAEGRAEREMHGRRDEGLRGAPRGLVLVPRHTRVGMVDVHDEADQPVPEQEGQAEADGFEPRDRLARGAGRERESADPGGGERGHENAVQREHGAPRGHRAAVGEQHARPPDLDQVVQPRRPAAAVQAFEHAARRAQRAEFLQRAGLPHEIEAAQVGVAVVHDVVAHLPQAVGRQRRQEHEAAEPSVELAVVGEALVAGVVADDEQAADHEARGDRGQHLQPRVLREHGGGQRGDEQREVERDERQRAARASAAERREPRADLAAGREVGRLGRRGVWGHCKGERRGDVSSASDFTARGGPGACVASTGAVIGGAGRPSHPARSRRIHAHRGCVMAGVDPATARRMTGNAQGPDPSGCPDSRRHVSFRSSLSFADTRIRWVCFLLRDPINDNGEFVWQRMARRPAARSRPRWTR